VLLRKHGAARLSGFRAAAPQSGMAPAWPQTAPGRRCRSLRTPGPDFLGPISWARFPGPDFLGPSSWARVP